MVTCKLQILYQVETLNFQNKTKPTLSSQVKAVSGKLSGERLGGRSCADASGAIVAIAISVASAIVVVGEMLGEMWRCRLEARGAIRAANRQRTEKNHSEKMTIVFYFHLVRNQYNLAILHWKNKNLHP